MPDTPPQDPMACYETLAEVSHTMLVAARAGDWQSVGVLERHCASLIAQQPSARTTATLRESQRRRRFEILRTVLVEDAEIRNLAQPWLLELEQRLIRPTTADHTAR